MVKNNYSRHEGNISSIEEICRDLRKSNAALKIVEDRMTHFMDLMDFSGINHPKSHYWDQQWNLEFKKTIPHKKEIERLFKEIAQYSDCHLIPAQ